MTKEAEKPVVPDWRAQYAQVVASLPETVSIPFHRTAEGGRWEKYKRTCPKEFLPKIDRTLLPNTAAFDSVGAWTGAFPGPCAFGPTDTAKTRAAWWALRVQYVTHGRAFAWFPVRRLCTELEKYESYNAADEFFRHYMAFPILMVDDVDKINWQFDSHKEMLFAFYDWVYRERRPAITTTNQPREWWEERMGEAFARRLFEDAHFPVKF